MQITLVLAVGIDWRILDSSSAVWKSAGYFVISTASIEDAIDQFQDGDFDLVLLGHTIPAAARENLTFRIRSMGARVPVACIVDSPGHNDSFADATFERDSTDLLTGLRELMKSKARTRPEPRTQHATTT